MRGRDVRSSGPRHDFDWLDALNGGLASVRRFEIVGRTSAAARRKNCRSSRADRFDAVYLLAAQAYMLISMPTATSTILGVFQVIPSSQEIWRELHAEAKPRTAPVIVQVRQIQRRTPAGQA